MQSFTRVDQSLQDQIEERDKFLGLQFVFEKIAEGDKLCEEYLDGKLENLAEPFNKYESAIATINNINNDDENPRTILDLYYEIDQHYSFKPTASSFAVKVAYWSGELTILSCFSAPLTRPTSLAKP